MGSAALGLCWVRDICAPKAPCARIRHFECKGRRQHGISAGAAFALEMLTPTTGCNHKAKNNAFGKLPRWAAPGWAAVGMQNVGARSGRCSRRPTAAVGPGGGGGAALRGQGRDCCPLCVQQQQRTQLLMGPAAPPCPAPRGTGSKAGGGKGCAVRGSGTGAAKGALGKGFSHQAVGFPQLGRSPRPCGGC